MKIAIIGSGGFGREVKQQILSNYANTEVFFFVDDLYSDSVSMPISTLNIKEYKVLVAIADPIVRKRIVESLPKDTDFFTFIHKSVLILDDNIEIGKGSIICANVVLTTNIKLGEHTQLNLATTIGHDTRVGEFFTTAPGAKISGNCEIENCVYIGTNSSIREKIKITNNVTVGLNSGVVKNINEPGVYVGSPAKKIK